MLLAEYDYDTDITVQRREAREEGIKYGFAIGEKAGEERGISMGVQQAKLETAKKFLAMGLSVEQVADGTGLSVEEIEKL